MRADFCFLCTDSTWIVISNVSTPFLAVKFFWILYAKWNTWQINFNCVKVFALAALNIYILFLHWQQWRSQPKIFWRAKLFDFRRVTIFCSGCHLSKHEMTIYAKNIAGGMASWAPLATPMIGNTTGIRTDKLLVATYALSYLCISVSNAVVEWVVSHVTSVFQRPVTRGSESPLQKFLPTWKNVLDIV